MDGGFIDNANPYDRFMRLIIITRPYFFCDEAGLINAFFESGLEILHLRKPNSNIDEYRALIKCINPRYYSQIVIHEHFELCEEYLFKGIHLNKRNPIISLNYNGHISASCHSFDEVEKQKYLYEYVFLSPIYDSISKQGYKSAFEMECLKSKGESGVIDSCVIALGGVTLSRIEELKNIGFGGVAVLGAAWDNPIEYINYLNKLRDGK